MEQKVYGPLSRPHSPAAMGRLRAYICRRASKSREVPEGAILQMVRGLQHLERASPPDNLFVRCLGRPQHEQAPSKALEEWERTICENKAVSILEKLQEGRLPLFQKDGGAMLAIVLDRPCRRRKIWLISLTNSYRRSDKS